MSVGDDEIKFTDAKEFNTEARLRAIHNSRKDVREGRVELRNTINARGRISEAAKTQFYETVRTYVYELEPYIKEVDGMVDDGLWTDTSFGIIQLEMPQRVRNLKEQLDPRADEVRVRANNRYKVEGFKQFVQVSSPIILDWELNRVSGMSNQREIVSHPHGMPLDISDLAARRANQFLFQMGVDMEISWRDWEPPDDYEGL
jgi:hypothetical protein